MSNTKLKESYRNEYFTGKHLGAGIKDRALRGAGATVFSQASLFGIQMFGTIVLARLLTPSDFGLVAMVAAFSFLFQNFGLRGFTEAVVQSDVITHEQISTLFWIQVALGVGVSLLFIALSPFIAWFYGEPQLVGICVVIGISFIFSALSTMHLALLQRNMNFYKLAANEVGANVITQATAIAMALWGWGYWALAARRVVPLVAMAGGAWILCRWIPGPPVKGTGVHSILKFGLHTYGNFATNYFSRNLDKVLLGWRYGSQLLGYYERAYYLFVMPVNQLSHPLTSVAVAALSRLRNDPEKYRNYYLKALSMLALFGMPLGAVLTLIGKDVLLLLLGPQWGEAGKVFSVFGPGIGITLIYGTHGWLHLSLGRADRWLRWGIVELMVTTVCFIAALPFGAIGIATAYTASFYILVGPGLWYAGAPANIGLLSYVRATWKFFISAVIAGLLCWIIIFFFNATADRIAGLNILLRIAVSVVLCCSFYLIIILVFFRGKEFIREFIDLMRNMMPKASG